MRNFSLAVAVAALLGSAGIASAAVVASAFSDDFSVSQASSTNDAASGFDTGSTLMTSYGSRLLQTDIISNTAPGDARGRTAITAGSGAFTYSSDDEVTGFGYVTYAFNTPISLTLTPDFQFTFLSNDALGTFSISVFDATGASGSVSYTLPVVAAGTAPVVLTVPANVVGVNSAAVTKLVFSFGGTKSEDLSVDSIAAVTIPEPGSLATVALLGSVVGVGLLARRRRA